MSLSVPHSAFWDWLVDFGPPSLKYSYTLHAKVVFSKPVIIFDSYMVMALFTFANLQSVSFKQPRPKKVYYILYFVFE